MNLRLLEVLTVFAFWLSIVNGQLQFSSSCNQYNVTGEANFDLKQISGIWYEIATYDNASCIVNEVSVVNETTIKISAKNWEEVQRVDLFTEFLAIRTDNSTGKFTITNPSGTLTRREDYYVVKSDFNGYLVGWSCSDVLVNGTTQSLQNLWIFSRNKTLNTKEMSSINETLTALNISQTELKMVQQDATVCGSSASELMKNTFNIVVFVIISIYAGL